MLRVYSSGVINRRAQMSPRACISRLTCIACCGSRPPRPSVAARIYIYVPARSCVCDVIVCVLVIARIIHMSPRARVYIYRFPIQAVGGSDVATRIFTYIAMRARMCMLPIHITHVSLCRIHSSAWCRNRCVAITLRRCVAIDMFLFVVSQSLFGVVSQSPCFIYLFRCVTIAISVVSQSLFGVVAHIPYARRCLYTRSARARCQMGRECVIAQRGLGVHSCGALIIGLVPCVNH